jgi:hypothetical protein
MLLLFTQMGSSMRAMDFISALLFLLILFGGILTVTTNAYADLDFSQKDINIGNEQYFVIGPTISYNEDIVKITGRFNASLPVDVYVTTDSTVKYGLTWSIDEIYNKEKLFKGKTEGKIDYKTPDKGYKYYILIVNPNYSNVNLNIDVTFHNEEENDTKFTFLDSLICISALIIGLIIVVIIIYHVKLKQKSKQSSHYPSNWSKESDNKQDDLGQTSIQSAVIQAQNSSQNNLSNNSLPQQRKFCSMCGLGLSYIPQNNRYYCYTCKKYDTK